MPSCRIEGHGAQNLTAEAFHVKAKSLLPVLGAPVQVNFKVQEPAQGETEARN